MIKNYKQRLYVEDLLIDKWFKTNFDDENEEEKSKEFTLKLLDYILYYSHLQ